MAIINPLRDIILISLLKWDTWDEVLKTRAKSTTYRRTSTPVLMVKSFSKDRPSQKYRISQSIFTTVIKKRLRQPNKRAVDVGLEPGEFKRCIYRWIPLSTLLLKNLRG